MTNDKSNPRRSPADSESGIDRLVRSIQRSEKREQGFRQLVTQYRPRLENFFARQGASIEEARDLTQDTFLAIDCSLPEFRGDAPFEAWLFRVARNVWRQQVRHWRAAKRDAIEVSLDGAGMADLLTMKATSATVLDSLLSREKLVGVLRAMETMPPQMRSCVLLRHSSELRYQEISERLAISVSAVKVQLHRARQRFRAQRVA